MAEIDWDNLPPSTIPENVGVTVKGLESAEDGQKLADHVFQFVHLIGSLMDLTSLDGVTVAANYDAALAELDRGIEGLRPLSRSNSNEVQGVAMSPRVKRGDATKTHLVFDASALFPLIADEATPEQRSASVSIIAHECAHVGITARKEAAVPEARFGTRIEVYDRAVLLPLADMCWDEYAACRISAPFAPLQTVYHSESLIAVIDGARETANKAIRSYRLHADINRVVWEAGAALFPPIKMASYVLGGMDGAEITWDGLVEVRQTIDEANYGSLIDELQDVLRQMWNDQDGWISIADPFAPLVAVVRKVFESAGIFIRAAPAGRVDIPYTPDTMPALP